MDGRNHLGRRISLLNESEGEQRSYSSSRSEHSSSSASSSSSSSSRSSSSSNRLPSLPRSLHSRTSSYASTPVLSPPQTPPLTRSDSSDSRIMQIPSPITPDFAFDAPFPPQQQLPSPLFPQKTSFFPLMAKDGQAMVYPPIPQQAAGFVYPQLAMPAAAQQLAFINPVSAQVAAPAPAPASPAKAAESSKGAPSSKGQSKKNQYPCPMAKQFNCPDYFTTSGHAARHAKKHTGRKDAVCPECNKAFTRKDNMEQHRRTHQNGRNAPKAGDETAAAAAAATAGASQPRKAAKISNSKRPRPSPLQPSNEAVPLIDPMLPTSPGSTFSDTTSLSQAGLQTLSSFSPYMEPTPYRYDLPTSFTAGLDTLAIVATGEDRKRKFDE